MVIIIGSPAVSGVWAHPDRTLTVKTGVQNVYPLLTAAAVTLPSHIANDWDYGAVTEVVALNAIAVAYTVVGVIVANVTAGLNYYQIQLNYGAGAGTTFAHVAFSDDTGSPTQFLPIYPWTLAANTRISAESACSNTADDADIRIVYIPV